MTNREPTGQYIGIDVSKSQLDVYLPSLNQCIKTENSSDGLSYLCDKLPSTSCHFILEATGGLEHLAHEYLATRKHKVSVVNPRQVRRTAQGLGHLAKTDKIDAKLLSIFGDILRPMEQEPRTPLQKELFELVSRRRQLSGMLSKEKVHLSSAGKFVADDIQSSIKELKSKIKALEEKLLALIEGDEKLSRTYQILLSIKGVGPVMAMSFITELPELGQLSSKKITALIGLAPYNCDSGRMKGKRVIFGGRINVRNTLYMTAMVAIKHNAKIKLYYEQLLERGKPKKVALVACMHKIATIANTLIKKNDLWRDDYQ